MQPIAFMTGMVLSQRSIFFVLLPNKEHIKSKTILSEQSEPKETESKGLHDIFDISDFLEYN